MLCDSDVGVVCACTGKGIFADRGAKLVEQRRQQLASYLTHLLRDLSHVLATPAADAFFTLQARVEPEMVR